MKPNLKEIVDKEGFYKIDAEVEGKEIYRKDNAIMIYNPTNDEIEEICSIEVFFTRIDY